MTPTSFGTAVAIALGASKATNIAKQLLEKRGIDRIPAPVKSITATALAVGGSVLTEDNVRNRVLTACAAAGLASVFHNAERVMRWRGDIDKIVFFREATKNPQVPRL